MYFAITNSIKKRFTMIFQDLIKQHPLFAEKTEVFTKFPEVERPKIAILVRSCSGSSVKLSLDNFAGTRQGFCFLANLKDIPGHSIEWVRDDIRNSDKLSPPGYYIVKMTDDTHFTVDPFYLVKDEPLDVIATFEKAAFVKNVPMNPGSDILFSSEGIDLKRNIDYSVDYTAGKITFLRPILSEETFTIDYQTLGNQTGPFAIDRYEFNNTAIPGAILAFGDRLKKDDEQVVIVEQDKNDVAQIYSGRWNLSLDSVIVAQDPDQQERLIDFVFVNHLPENSALLKFISLQQKLWAITCYG
jgi:hypothetical protein